MLTKRRINEATGFEHRPNIYEFLSKNCFLYVVQKKQKFSFEVIHLVQKFGEDRIFNEQYFWTQDSIFESPIFNFTHSGIAGTGENIKIDCINYVSSIHQIWYFYHNLHDFTLNCRTTKQTGKEAFTVSIFLLSQTQLIPIIKIKVIRILDSLGSSITCFSG